MQHLLANPPVDLYGILYGDDLYANAWGAIGAYKSPYVDRPPGASPRQARGIARIAQSSVWVDLWLAAWTREVRILTSSIAQTI